MRCAAILKTVRRPVGGRYGVALALCVMGSLTGGSPFPARAETPGEVPAEEPGVGAGDGVPQGERGRPSYVPRSGVEEIVVTGEVLDPDGVTAPTSSVSFDDRELQALGAQDVSDLAVVTPNLEIKTVSNSAPTFFIRGVGLADFNSNATGAVAIYQDGAPINAPALQLGQLFDSQVAVLRGPQPYGNWRNASAGAINLVSKLPGGELQARLRADYGNYDFKDFEGFLSVPLLGERLAGRMSFRFSERDPLVDNQCGGLAQPTRGACGANPGVAFAPRFVPAGLPTEVNDEGHWSARGILRWQPDAHDMDWVLNFHGSRLDHLAPLGQVIGTQQASAETRTGYIDPAIQAIYERNLGRFSGLSPPAARREAFSLTLDQVTRDIGLTRPFDNGYNLIGKEKLDTWGGSLSGDLVLGNIQLKWITGGESYDRTRLTDFDFSPNTAIHSDASDAASQITQSLELESELPELPVRWRSGGYFLTETLESDTRFAFSASRSVQLINNLVQGYGQDTYSFGVYGSFEWDFLEHFALEGGVRYNWERKTFDMQVARAINGVPDPGATQPASDAQTWSAPSGGISLRYQAWEAFSPYLKYSRGWKAGHFNAAILENEVGAGGQGFVPDITFARPESVDAVEAGFSSNLWEGRLETRGALFYYTYSDYQVFVLQNAPGATPQFEIINANDAEIYGAELEVFAQPLLGFVPAILEGLRLQGRLGWLESTFLDFSRERQVAIGGAVISDVIDFTGNRLPNTPRFKASGSLEYPLDLGRWGSLAPRYDFSYTDDVFFDPSNGTGTPPPPGVSELPLPAFSVGQTAYWLHNARLGYRVPQSVEDRVGALEVSLWVRNFTDERYKTFVADAVPLARSLLNFVGDPRTYGISVSMEY